MGFEVEGKTVGLSKGAEVGVEAVNLYEQTKVNWKDDLLLGQLNSGYAGIYAEQGGGGDIENVLNMPKFHCNPVCTFTPIHTQGRQQHRRRSDPRIRKKFTSLKLAVALQHTTSLLCTCLIYFSFPVAI